MNWLLVKLQVFLDAFVSWLRLLLVGMRESRVGRGLLYRMACQLGEFGVQSIVGLAVGMMVIGAVVAALWDKIAATDTAIQLLEGTDEGTLFLQGIWGTVILLCALAIGVGVIMWVLHKLDII